jgi:hypothetical protein
MPKLSFIDWIWRARGAVELDPPRTPQSAFARLDPLLDAASQEIDGDTLTYVKDNPAAQDKLATFSRGTLQVVEEGGAAKLRYDLFSPALLLCALAPLLFLAIAQATIVISDLESAAETEKASDAEEEEDEEEPRPLNIVDQMLGAPPPETLEQKKQRMEEKEEEEDGKHSPTPAFVFAGLFFALFLVGRVLEPWLVRRTFRQVLNTQAESSEPEPGHPAEV